MFHSVSCARVLSFFPCKCPGSNLDDHLKLSIVHLYMVGTNLTVRPECFRGQRITNEAWWVRMRSSPSSGQPGADADDGAAMRNAVPRQPHLPPSSPARERGIPPPHASLPHARQPLRPYTGTRGGRRSAPTNHPQPRAWILEGSHRQRGPARREEEESIQEWFGQLWFVPEPPVSRHHQGARVQEASNGTLVWIQKSLWDSRSFKPEDCFPLQPGDRCAGPPRKFDFAIDSWAKGARKTFLQAVETMAGGGRGRGRGPRQPPPDEEWAWRNGWMQPPSPQFYPPAAPPPYGFYLAPPFPPPPQFHHQPIHQHQPQNFPRGSHQGGPRPRNNQGARPKGGQHQNQPQQQQMGQQQQQQPPQMQQQQLPPTHDGIGKESLPNSGAKGEDK